MSEETKTPEGDYVMMGPGGTTTAPGSGATLKMPGLDDPNLSQEEKDHRMAIALQQEENSFAYDAHKKKHEDTVKAHTNRTARSGTFSKLAAIRDKDHGMLSVPAQYTTENAYVKSDGDYIAAAEKSEDLSGATPQQIADYQLAKELQKVEQVEAGTVQEMTKIVVEEKSEAEAQNHRTGYSNHHINQHGLRLPTRKQSP
mmetsp:Transcript_50138/g.121490  ORF Transcript_50138/g.121490 Transcript_50138/m.121490 type:complete len:200 (+) Transcript_50138:160-759(+)|eukprot:CAMPEP_0113453592 /NCGR_PEP_ID=MMETSP0014_2-20120614/7433_1 /TAXON_ID=2857 /ORGANISM="Nitzschia sp." /LENGTH=199 /DNA_ID=CAMNT_0000344983 /DNA_START=160 /DNA_END=759 /DNA_ORIENTATION=- /assembly_acc=CAM_ASM_000159